MRAAEQERPLTSHEQMVRAEVTRVMPEISAEARKKLQALFTCKDKTPTHAEFEVYGRRRFLMEYIIPYINARKRNAAARVTLPSDSEETHILTVKALEDMIDHAYIRHIPHKRLEQVPQANIPEQSPKPHVRLLSTILPPQKAPIPLEKKLPEKYANQTFAEKLHIAEVWARECMERGVDIPSLCKKRGIQFPERPKDIDAFLQLLYEIQQGCIKA